MPTYYEIVGEEPTYRLAEIIIKANIQELKKDSGSYRTYPRSTVYTDYPETVGYRFVSCLPTNKRSDIYLAMHLIIQHFPDVLKNSSNALYIKDSHKHLLSADDLLVMDYYLLLLNQYDERANKYQRYLKKQEDKQHLKLLFVLSLPFILLILMILVGD